MEENKNTPNQLQNNAAADPAASSPTPTAPVPQNAATLISQPVSPKRKGKRKLVLVIVACLFLAALALVVFKKTNDNKTNTSQQNAASASSSYFSTIGQTVTNDYIAQAKMFGITTNKDDVTTNTCDKPNIRDPRATSPNQIVCSASVDKILPSSVPTSQSQALLNSVSDLAKQQGFLAENIVTRVLSPTNGYSYNGMEYHGKGGPDSSCALGINFDDHHNESTYTTSIYPQSHVEINLSCSKEVSRVPDGYHLSTTN